MSIEIQLYLTKLMHEEVKISALPSFYGEDLPLINEDNTKFSCHGIIHAVLRVLKG